MAARKPKAESASAETEESKPPVSPTPPPGMYPRDAELFMYTPESTGVPIWFPLDFESPDIIWIWELYDKPFHVQSWEWMKQAKVPREMQRRVVELLRDHREEYLDLFNKWLKAAGRTDAGE